MPTIDATAQTDLSTHPAQRKHFLREALLIIALGMTLAACGGGSGSSAPPDNGRPAPSVPDAPVVGPAVQFPGHANDVVWDERRQVLYLSLPSAAGPNGNAIVALDPKTNTVVRSQFSGSEPNVLSISDDGQFLYASLDGTASVQRFKLPELTPDLVVPLGRDPEGGAYHAVDLSAVPGSPRSFVVGQSVYAQLDSVLLASVFDDAAPRPLTVAHCRCSSFQWGDSGSQLYAGDNEDTGFNFQSFQVDAAGLQTVANVVNAFSSFGSRIHYSRDTRLLYSDDGIVFDPVAAQRVTQVSVRGTMTPDTARNRLYYAVLEGTASVVALDATTYQRVGKPQPLPLYDGQPSRMVRWGAEGLALTTTGGGVLLFGGSGVSKFDAKVPVGTAQRVVIPGTVNRVVWNAASARVYATFSQASPTLTGSVVAIDPATSQITATRYVGAEPDALAVSDDGKYLYVGLDEIGKIQRFKLPGLDLDATFLIGAHPQYGPYIAGNIQVAPGNPLTIAVSRLSPTVVPAEQGGIVVFDDVTPRPVSAPSDGSYAEYNDLVWSDDGQTIYSSTLIRSQLNVLAVDENGVRLDRTIPGTFATPGHLHRAVGNGILYHDSGRAVDPSSGLPIGRYKPGDNSPGAEQVVADAPSNRVFTLATLTPAPGEPQTWRIDAFDMARQVPVARYPIAVATGFPFDFVQSGPTTFAFRSTDGVSLVRVQGPG